jgi:flagellar biosynthetic protein FliR
MALEQWSVFLLIFTRITALIAVLPVFSWRGVPALTKIGFSALTAYLLFLAGGFPVAALPGHFILYLLAVGSEVLLGITLGFLVLLHFTAVRIAGQLIDLQAGFMMSSIFDPLYGSQVTILGHFYYLFATVLYLSLDGHHLLFSGLARSLTVVPPGGAVFQVLLFPTVIQFFSQMFVTAFQLAAPVVVVLIFSDMALGLISKTVPQIHVFMVGMPLKAGGALLIIYLIFPYFVSVLGEGFRQMSDSFFLLLRLF